MSVSLNANDHKILAAIATLQPNGPDIDYTALATALGHKNNKNTRRSVKVVFDKLKKIVGDAALAAQASASTAEEHDGGASDDESMSKPKKVAPNKIVKKAATTATLRPAAIKRAPVPRGKGKKAVADEEVPVEETVAPIIEKKGPRTRNLQTRSDLVAPSDSEAGETEAEIYPVKSVYRARKTRAGSASQGNETDGAASGVETDEKSAKGVKATPKPRARGGVKKAAAAPSQVMPSIEEQVEEDTANGKYQSSSSPSTLRSDVTSSPPSTINGHSFIEDDAHHAAVRGMTLADWLLWKNDNPYHLRTDLI